MASSDLIEAWSQEGVPIPEQTRRLWKAVNESGNLPSSAEMQQALLVATINALQTLAYQTYTIVQAMSLGTSAVDPDLMTAELMGQLYLSAQATIYDAAGVGNEEEAQGDDSAV